MKALLLGLLFTCLSIFSYGQEKKTRILFLMDASGSMYARMDNNTRINVAKKMIANMADSLKDVENVEVALRVYGHSQPKEKRVCTDTELLVPFGKKNHEDIKEAVADIRPRGYTLIAYSLQEAAYDFPEGDTRNIIILITDGIEECDGDPCAVSEALQKQGVILKPFIIGIGMDKNFKSQFDCVGKYFEANTENAFENILNLVVSQALNNTSCQINLLDSKGLPTETDLNISFYDASNGRFIHNTIHTLNDEENPDTIYLDPAYNYDIIVHTIPPVVRKNVEIMPGEHTVIDVPTPQGSISLEMGSFNSYGRLTALIYDHKTKELVHVQEFGKKEPYILGTYDIHILSTPKIYLSEIEVKQSKTTTLKIPGPGTLNLISREDFVGDLYRYKNGEYEWVANIDVNVGSQRIPMQPGTYVVVVRSMNERNMHNARRKEFEIYSGKSYNLKL
jgi:Ca-activated chloride channel family protein